MFGVGHELENILMCRLYNIELQGTIIKYISGRSRENREKYDKFSVVEMA